MIHIDGVCRRFSCRADYHGTPARSCSISRQTVCWPPLALTSHALMLLLLLLLS